jgi:hypothetical protein
MKSLSFLMLFFSLSAIAITIDEAGTSRPRKPSLTLSYEVENSPDLERSMAKLMNLALNNLSSSLIIEADLDGDGELESYNIDPSKEGKFYPLGWEASRKESQGESSALKSCCSGMATGRRQYNPILKLNQGQISLESENGALKLSSVSEDARVRRNRLSADYMEVSFAQYNPKEISLDKARKGWDGTVKGSSKRNDNFKVSLVSEKGEVLSSVSLKTKGEGKTEVCGSSQMCGKTDHL